jgi:hypothetical protein
MLAGHIGAGLAIGRADRRINVGVLIFAALLLDLLLWLFILLGWESASIPADFAGSHQPHFTFPYSHGLVGSLAWSLLAALAAYWWFPRPGATRRSFMRRSCRSRALNRGWLAWGCGTACRWR